MGAYVTDRSTPLLVAAEASNRNSEPPKTPNESPGPSTYTSKDKTRPSLEDIRPLPKAGPRKTQNVKKKKKKKNKTKTTAILTD